MERLGLSIDRPWAAYPAAWWAEMRQWGVFETEIACKGQLAQPQAVASLGARLHGAGLAVWSVHLPFGPAWDVSADPRDGRLQRLEDHLTGAAELGAHCVVLHPSHTPLTASRSACVRFSRAAIAHLGQRARTLGLALAVENLPRSYLAGTVAELAELLPTGVGVCLDVNHPMQETAVDFARRLAPRVVTVHLSDSDGREDRHWLPGEGCVDFGTVRSTLLRAGYEGPWMLEIHGRRAGGGFTPKEAVQALLGQFSRDIQTALS